jgi:chromosome segregation protein
MQLKKIDIHGFKSIAKKTSLSFPGGVTCIVGPNGCGKSNITDAFRWVLGEQSTKTLRASSMEDVIFTGTEESPAGSMASVTMEFVRNGGYFPQSLDGFNEISISRQLFRTGESIYSLNGVRCRLKDISNLFLDSGIGKYGYSMIGQGMIEDIVQGSPDDIRLLIEEAAGVGKFRIQRADAIKRLEKTTLNLERIKDLLSEISKQRDTLQSHANKAKRYQIFRKEINDLTQILWTHELSDIKKQIDIFHADEELKNVLIKEEHAKIAATKESFREQKQLSEKKKQDLDGLSNNLIQKKNKLELTERDINSCQERLKDFQSTKDMLLSRIDQIQQYSSAIHTKIQEEKDDLIKIEQRLAESEEETSKHQTMLDTARSQYDEIQKSYEHERTSLFDLIGHSKVIEQRMSSTKQREQEVDVNIRSRNEELEEVVAKKGVLENNSSLAKQEVAKLEGYMKGIEETISSLTMEKEGLDSMIEQESQGLIHAQQEYSAISAKIALLEDIIKRGTSSPKNKNLSENDLKKVGDIIRVMPGFEDAVGRSIGDGMEYAVTDSYQVALEYIDKEIYPGFVPNSPLLDANASMPLPSEPGVLGYLKNFIETQENFRGIRDALAGDMMVIEDIHIGLSLLEKRQLTHNAVTKNGIILEKTGVIKTTPTHTKYVEVLKAKTEKESLSLKKESLTLSLQGIKDRLDEKNAKSNLIISKINDMKEDLAEKSARLSLQTHYLAGISAQLEHMQATITSFNQDLAMWSELKTRLENEFLAAKTDKEETERKIEEKQIQVKDLGVSKEEHAHKMEDMQKDLQAHVMTNQELKITCTSRNEGIKKLEEQVKKEEEEVSEDRKRLAEIDKNEKEVFEAIASHSTLIEGLKNEIQGLEEFYSSLSSEYTGLQEKIISIEKDIESLQENISSMEKQHDEISLNRREKQIAFDMAQQRLHSMFGEAEAPAIPEEFDPVETQQKIEKIQFKLEKMGQINFTSIEEYEAVQKRWEDLNVQYLDLTESHTKLKQVIENIEKEARKEFNTTFSAVKKNFSEIFIELFSGGKADLVLQDNDSLEGGVEIMACPPHKKLRHMSLLSGGEKALCALSLIFALFQVRPSTFCILDEVDAPLDDANIDRFKKLIKKFSEESHFIIVTHSKQTMAMADTIYGITFETPGISKVISMEFQ